MSLRPLTRRTLLGAAGLTGLGALAACAPGEAAPTTAPTSAGTGGATTPATGPVDPSTLGDVTLVVWDQEVRGSQNDALVALNEAFQARYPNIKIERTSQSTDDLKTQVTLALSGAKVPDVVQVNNARADMGQFVTAGQLTDLSPYAAAYGWEDRIPASVLSKVRYSADGTTFGEGNLYGLPQTGEVVGLYYSQKKLDALGATPPTTWDEYFALLDKAKGTGVFLPGGSWLGPDMEKVMGDDVRFMAPPPALDGRPATTGGTGIPFSIPAKAANKDAAAAYLDFVTTSEAMAIIAEKGGFPVIDAAKLAPTSGIQHDIFAAYDEVATGGTLLPYLDYATPTFADTAGAGLQEVLGGQRTPEQVLADFEADYAAFTA